jgi:Fur family ferric uptake transcriptional regulator
MNISEHKRICTESLEFLSLSGQTVTPFVRDIVRRFFASDKHISADDLAHAYGESGTKKEVEKVLYALVSCGFAVEKKFADGVARYEHLHIGEHHDHFFCIRCGKIVEFLSPRIETLQREEAEVHGFHPFSHRLQIDGLCATCFGRTAERHMPLINIPNGGHFTVKEVKGEGSKHQAIIRHLTEMGLPIGTMGEVISKNFGLTIVIVGSSRLAINKKLGKLIIVSLQDE